MISNINFEQLVSSFRFDTDFIVQFFDTNIDPHRFLLRLSVDNFILWVFTTTSLDLLFQLCFIDFGKCYPACSYLQLINRNSYSSCLQNDTLKCAQIFLIGDSCIHTHMNRWSFHSFRRDTPSATKCEQQHTSIDVWQDIFSIFAWDNGSMCQIWLLFFCICVHSFFKKVKITSNICEWMKKRS